MINIAQNPFYEIRVDVGKNRALLTIKGGWSQEREVSQYLEHWAQALTFLKPGFCVLSDVREANEHSLAIRELHLTAQRMLNESGLFQIAEVHNLNEPGSDHAIELAQESQIPLNIFDNLEDAEAWLQEVGQEKK